MSEAKTNDNNHRILQILHLLESNPKDCFLLHALALENIKKGDIMEAQNLFERVLSHDATYVGTYYHLGKLLENKGKKSKAIEVYQEGIKMAHQKGDFHSLNELRGALDNLMEEDLD
jgi:tetratricopeptide (TPR) repeat protein